MVAPTHLKSLQALELAARLGSLKDAAGVLAITPAAVGQRVKALEDYLGRDLLMRGRSGLRPAPALENALVHLRAAFHELDLASEALNLERVHDLHIAAPSDFVDLWLAPRLPRFRKAHPAIRFCINGEGDAPLRFASADCEISFGPRHPAAEADILFRDFIVPIASPENARRVASIAPRDRLEGFPLLHLDFYRNDPAAPGWPRWVEANRLRRTAPERGIRHQRIVPALEAIAADAGVALCGIALIAEMIDDGRIMTSFPLETGVRTEHAFQARFRAESTVRPQLRRFRQWLLAEAGATRTWLTRTTGKKAWT
jgi:LysR family glycine cleavage system transcriptional activator